MSFNSLLRPFMLGGLEKQILINPILVKSEDQQADKLSRWSYDKGDYTLDMGVFQKILHLVEPFRPEVDMFASPGNAKLEKFVARWAHHRAIGVDALKMDVSLLQKVYANPPGL